VQPATDSLTGVTPSQPVAGNPGTNGLPSLTAAASAATIPQHRAIRYPRGSYVNWDFTKSLANVTFDTGIVGITLSVPWKSVQSGPKAYNWGTLDSRLQEAKKAHLKVALMLNTGPSNTPAFILNNPQVQTITFIDTNSNHGTYGQNITGPVFWDPAYIAGREAFIQAAGARYLGNPTVTAVNCSFANWYTNDWDVPHYVGKFKQPGGGTIYLNQVQQWLTAGYSTSVMESVGQQIIDTTAAAFPGRDLKMAIGTTSSKLDGTSTQLAADILAYAYGKYPNAFYAQVNKLGTQTPTATDPKVTHADPNSTAYLYYLLTQYSPRIGLQMVADATNGANDGYRLNGGKPGKAPEVLQNAVNVGLTYTPEFLEYWTVDGKNSALTSIFQGATSAMQAH
jgi:hypothetical protein